jgi:hypothetical protein
MAAKDVITRNREAFGLSFFCDGILVDGVAPHGKNRFESILFAASTTEQALSPCRTKGENTSVGVGKPLYKRLTASDQ